jgi:predicted N-acyltransferase
VDDVGKTSLDSLSNDGLFTYGWLKTVETSSSFNLDPYYVTVWEKNRLVAFAPCFLNLADDFSSYAGPTVLPLMKKLLSFGGSVGLWQSHRLVCYSPMCYRTRVLVEKGIDETSILRLVSGEVDFLCRRERILFSSFLYVSEHDRFLTSSLEGLGYQKYPYDDVLYLDINWTTFDEYLGSLRHHVSNNIRREIRKCLESGIEIELVSEFGDLAETLSTFRGNLIWKRSRVTNPFDVVFYKRLTEFASDKVRLFVARKNGHIVGFCCCFQQGDTLDVNHCGFNYQVLGRNDFAYFNLAYYTPIKWAIENHIKKMYYARELPDLKKRRGLKPEKVYSFVKCQNRVLSVYTALLNTYLLTPGLRRRAKRMLFGKLT